MRRGSSLGRQTHRMDPLLFVRDCQTNGLFHGGDVHIMHLLQRTRRIKNEKRMVFAAFFLFVFRIS